MEEILKVTDLKKVYGKRGAATTALNGVSFSLRGGEYVGIMGASGSGKTTLLHCVSTIDRPTSGSILVEDVYKRQRGGCGDRGSGMGGSRILAAVGKDHGGAAGDRFRLSGGAADGANKVIARNSNGGDTEDVYKRQAPEDRLFPRHL